MEQSKKILGVGSIALDTLDTIEGKRNDILGGSSTYFGIASSLFSSVCLVGVVGEDFPQSAWELFSKKNIDVENIQIESGPTFRWGGKYNNDYSNRETLFTELGVFETFKPNILRNYKNTDYLFLGNIQPELQLHVANQMHKTKKIVCDTMNLWIDLSIKKLWEVIKIVDIFMLNDEEALQLTGLNSIADAANKLLNSGPSVIVIKKGAKGALLAYNNNHFQIPVFPIEKLVDPTGAGDSFAGGFIGHLVSHGDDNLIEAVITGSAIASFTVSDFGVEGLLKATKESVDSRKNIIRNLMREKNHE